jgi:putative peptidoglycan lipid II flippase
LKIGLMAPLAQIGLALATAVGAWINLLLVLGFAVRAGYLELDRRLMLSFGKFAASGFVLAGALWWTERFAAVHFAQMHLLRDETILLLLIAVGAFVYGFCVLVLFGRGWLFALWRG